MRGLQAGLDPELSVFGAANARLPAALAADKVTVAQLARELAPDGIRVNAISPGLVITDTVSAELPESTKTRVKAMQLLDTFGAEQDIVDTLLFLTSDKARFLTGETLRVTGGMAARNRLRRRLAVSPTPVILVA